ncbi:MAG: RHS repeat-associated core domain-containing protein, partial [Gammaproteobacteria bacterium]|nr:RHS repeat-associated core domain-containing protein [Gammaproteobacteria bacterium]
YKYTQNGRKDIVTYPNDTSIKYNYSDSDRISDITHRSGIGTIISKYDYTYDLNGNRKTQAEKQDGTEETTDYNYDAADRLKNYTVNGSTDSIFTGYTYEAYNRKTEDVLKNGISVKARVYDYESNTDRLRSVDHTDWVETIDNTDPDNPKIVRVPVPKTFSYTYDNNGNMLTKSDSSEPLEILTFNYDSRDRLVQTARGPPGSQTLLGQYDYNAGGMRVRHLRSERGDVDYYYDGNSVIEERNTDGTLLAHYRYADRLFRLDTPGGTQYYHHDALGSTVNLTGSTGSAEVSYKLDPWGHILNQPGTTVNRHVFTGQEHDENTGLIYFDSRYYDPDIVRFITQDAYPGEQGIPSSRHRYVYVYSNPAVYIDPNGHSPIGIKDAEGRFPYEPSSFDYEKNLGIPEDIEKQIVTDYFTKPIFPGSRFTGFDIAMLLGSIIAPSPGGF